MSKVFHWEMTVMELHYIDGSPFARIVRVLMREHGIACGEIEVVEFPPADAFFDLNPLGQVPVLIDNGRRYFPTRIVIEALLLHVSERDKAIAAAVSRPDHWLEDEQVLSVILAMGDAVAAHHYYQW